MTDAQTMACYAKMAHAYADKVSRAVADDDLLAFMNALPGGNAPVLDWGCGPGNSAALMTDAGLHVVATDASPEMAAIAADLGISVRVEPFESLTPDPTYRGIWANFSLLHAPPEDVRKLIDRAARALLPDGILHLGMKEGRGSARDSLGRFYSYWSADDLDHATEHAGLEPVSVRHGEGKGLDGRVEPFVIHLTRRPRS